jgi:hypothetical protein
MANKKDQKKRGSKQEYETPQLKKITVSKIHQTPMMSSGGGPVPYIYIA